MVSAAIPKVNPGTIAASQVIQTGGSVRQGVGFGLGLKLVDWAGSLVKNLIPEYPYLMGLYAYAIIFVYWQSFLVGFASIAVWPSHLTLGLIGLGAFMLDDSINKRATPWESFRANGGLFGSLLIIDYMLLTGTFHFGMIIGVAILFALREGNAKEDIKQVAIIVAFFGILIYFYTHYGESFSGWVAGWGILPFLLLYVVNKTVTFPFFWYLMFGMPSRTRVATSIALYFTILLIAANWGNLFPAVQKEYLKYNPGIIGAASEEQKGVLPNALAKGISNIRTAFGDFIGLKWANEGISAAYEKAEKFYGFGEVEEEPKVGLKIVPAGKTSFKAGEAVMPRAEVSIISPLPLDSEQKSISIVGVGCKDLETNIPVDGGFLSYKSGKTSVEPISKKPFPLAFGSSKTVACRPLDGLEAGAHQVEITVRYRMVTSAYFSTSLIRADEAKALQAAGYDLAVAKRVPPAIAKFRNTPVAITFDPVELVDAPAPVYLTDYKGEGAEPLFFDIYVSRNPLWNDGEIAGINSMTVYVPKGIALVGNTCPFIIDKVASERSATDVYNIEEEEIKKTGGILRVIGKGDSYECVLEVNRYVLEGRDIAGVLFNVKLDFEFAEDTSIAFDVMKGEN